MTKRAPVGANKKFGMNLTPRQGRKKCILDLIDQTETSSIVVIIIIITVITIIINNTPSEYTLKLQQRNVLNSDQSGWKLNLCAYIWTVND